MPRNANRTTVRRLYSTISIYSMLRNINRTCPFYISQHRIDRDRRQSLLTVVLFALLGIEQIEIVDRVFLQLSYLYFLASNRQRSQIESSYSCPICTSWHQIDRDSRQSLLTVVLFALLGIEQIEIVDRVFLQLSYLYFLASNRQRQQMESSLTVVLFILLSIEQIEIVDRVFLQLSYLYFLASNRQRSQIESSYSCPICTSWHRIDRDSRQSLLTVVLFALLGIEQNSIEIVDRVLLTVVLFALLGIEQIEIVDRVFLQLSYLYFLASNRQRSQIESSYSCPICTSWHRIDRDSRQSLLTVVLFALLVIEQIEIVDRVFLQLSFLYFLASNRQRSQIESSYSCPICTSWHRIDRDRRQSLLTVVLFILLSIEQIEIVDRVFLQLSYLHFLASNRQRQQIESSYSCPICTSCHRIDRDSRQSLLTVVLFILLSIEQIEIVDRVFLQLSYLHFLASNRQRQQIESSYSCPICTSWHRIDRDSRQSLLTVVLFIFLSIEQIEIVDRVFLQLSYLHFLASNRQRSQIESSYSCPIYTSQHRIDRDRRQSLLTVVLFALLGIEQIEIVDRVFLQLSYLHFLASNRQRQQIESSYSCPIYISQHRIDRDRRQSLLTVVLFALLGIEQIEIVDRVFLQLSYLYFLASNRQRSQIESSYSCPICTSWHRIDRDRRQSLLTVVLFILLGIEQIEIVDRVFLQLSYLHFLASNRQRQQIESSYSCPICTSWHRIDRDSRQSLLTVVLFALLGIEQIEIVDRVFLQLSYLYFLASNRQRQQIESSYSCPIYTSQHRIDRDRRQSLLTVVLFILLSIEQIEIVDRVFLQLSYLHFLASNRQRSQIESSYSCPICTSWHRIDRDRRQSLLTVVLFALLGIEQIEIVDRVFLQLSYLHFLASNRQRSQIESSYSCPICTSWHRIDRDRRQSLLTVVLFALLVIEQIEIVDRVFLQLSFLYFLASNRQRSQIESSYSCPIYTSQHRIDRDRRQSLLTVVLFALLGIEQIEIVDRVFLQLSYLHFLASNRQRQQIESSYSCPICTSWHRIDRDSRQSLLTVVLFALLGIEQIEIVDRVFLQLSYLYFLASNRQRSQIESSYSCPICTSWHRIDRDSRQSLLTVVLFALLGIEQIEIVDRVFLQLSYLHFLASNRQRQQIESSYSCPIYTSWHRIDRDRRQSLLTVVLFILLSIEQIEIVDRVFLQLSYLYFLASNRQRQQIESSYSCPICTSCIEQIEIVDRVFLQLSYLHFLASNRQRSQIESSYSCPICTSWHRIDRDSRQSLLTVVLFILLSIEQIEIVDRVFLQLSYLHFLASNRQRSQIESSYSCPIYTSWHRIDRDSRQSLLTVVLFALLGIEQIEIVDRVFLQLSYLYFLASNRQRSQIESSYSCPICTSWHRIDRDRRQSLLTVVLFILLSIEQIEIVDRVFLQLSYLHFLASNRQRQQIESSYSCPICTSWHRIDRDSRQSLLTVVLFIFLSIEQIEIVDRVFLQLSYLYFLASNRQRSQIESSYSCPIYTSQHRIDRDRRQSLLTVVLFILLSIEQIEIVDRVFLQLSYLHFLASNRQRSQIESSYSCPIYTSQHRIDRDRRQSLLTVVLFALLGIEQIEIVDRVFLQLSYLHFLASNRQRQQIESSYSCPIYTSQHRIDRDSRQSLLTVVLFILLGIEQIEIVDRVFLQLSYLHFLHRIDRDSRQSLLTVVLFIFLSIEQIEIVDRVFLQLSYLHFLASNRQRSQIESSYSCPIYTSQHRIDRDRRQSLLTVVLFALLGIKQIEIVDRVFLQLSYLHFLASNRQRQQIESSYSCPIYTSQHRIDRDSRQSLLTVVLFILLGIEQIEIVDRVFLQLSYLYFLASNRQRQQIESSYSCPICTSWHRIDRDSRQSLLTVVLFIFLSIEQIEIVDRVFLQLSYLHFLASNRQRSQIESSYSCPIYTSQHRIDRDRRQSLLTVVLFALLGIKQIEIVDRVFLQLSYLHFLASNRQRQQIESSYSCPIYISQHRIDRDSRQSLLTVVLFALLGIEQIEIVDRVFLQLSYLYFLASNRQRSQIESSYSCPIYTSQHRIDRDSRQSLLTVVLFALLGIEQIEIVDRVFLQLSYLHFLASNRQRQQIESSYSCPICTSWHRIDRDSRQSLLTVVLFALLSIEQIEIVDRVFLQLSYLYFLASNRQRSQIESSYSCPIYTSQHRIDRDRRQSLLTVVLFALLGIKQIEIVDRVFLQLSYLHFLASNRQRQQIESSYSCPIYISQHRIDRDSRQSLLTVVLFILLGIEQIEIVDRVFLQLSYLYFLASNRQRSQIESSYSCPIYTSQHRIDRDRRQSLLTVVLFALLGIEQIEIVDRVFLQLSLFALLGIEQIEIVDRVFLQLSYLYFLASNRQRSQIESSYSCPIYTSQHRIDRDRRQSLLTVVLFDFLASNRQRSQIESSYSCPIYTSQHRIDRDSRQSLLTVVLLIRQRYFLQLSFIIDRQIVDRVFLQLSYLHFLASNRQRSQIESSYSCPIYTSQHRIDRDRRQSLLTVVLFALLGIEQIEIVDRVFLQLSYLYFLASNRQRSQIESSYSCPIYTSQHRIDRDSRQSLLTVVLFALLGIEQIEIVDRVFLQLSYLYFLASNRQRQQIESSYSCPIYTLLASNRQRSQIESSYSCPIYTSQHRIDRDRRQSLLTVVLFALLGIEQIEIVDRVFLQLSYLYFLASNRQRSQIESSYSCPICTSWHRIDRDRRQSLLTVVLFILLSIEQIEIVDRVFLQLSYLYFLASNRQRQQIESSYSCPICTSWHRIDRDSRQSLLTVVLFALLGIEQIEIVDRVFLQLSYLHFLASNRQRQQIESSYSCPIYISQHRIDRDRRQSLLTVVLFILLGIEQIEIVDRVFLQLSYLYFLASNRQRSQIESSYSCPICTSWHRIDRDSRQSLLTVVLFALLGIEQIEIVDRVFLQLSYLYFLASNRQRSQIESSYSCPICTSWHRIDRDRRQSLLTVVLFILLSIEQIEIVDRVFLQLSYLHFLASNRQRSQIESSYSCPICTSWHRIDRDSRQSLLTVVLFALLGIEQIEIVDRVFLQLSYLYFLASNRQRWQIESSYSCPIYTSQHRIDRDRRQSLLTVVLFILLSIEQIEIVDRVFLQLSYLYFLASNRQRQQIESSYSCPICTSWHRIDRDRRQSLLTVVLFILLSIEQIEIVDRVFLQLSYLHFLASNRQRSQIESSYSCPIYTSQHRIDRDRRQSLLTVVLFALLGIEQIEIVDRVFLQLSYLHFLHRIDRDSRQSLLTVVLFILLSIEQIEIVDRVFLQLSYLYFLHRIDRDRRQSLLTVVLFILLGIEQIEIVDRVFLQLSYLHFLASNRQRQQIESSYSCPFYISQHRIDRDRRQSLLTVVLFALLGIEQIEIVDRVFLQLSYLYFLASNRQRSQIESSYSCPICTSWHRIDRVDRVFLQLSYLHFLASNRQRQQIESSYSCPIYASQHRIDRDSRQSLLTVVLFILLSIEQIEIVDRVFLQLSYLYFLASNRQRQQIESSYSCPICTSWHRIDRDRRQSLLTVVLFALLVIEQIEIVDRVFLQLSFLYFLASNRQRSQIESSYSCPICTSWHRIDRDRRQSLLTVVLFILLSIEQIEIVDRVFLQLSYLHFLASNRQRQQIESSYSCPIYTSQHRIDRDSRQSLLTVVLFALLGIEQIEIVDRVFLQLSYLHFLASNRQRQQIESSYSCPICTSWHRIDRDSRQSLLTVVLFILLSIEQIEIVDRVFLQLSYLYFLASNRQRQQIESSYSCPICTSWHRIDRDSRQSLLTVVLFALLGIEQIEIVDRVFLQLSYLHFLASNRQRQQIESSYSCPFYISQHRIDRDRRQSLLTVVLFALLGIEQIEIVDRVFLQLSYLYFLASNRQRSQIESSYSCPICTSWHRIDRDSRQSLLTVVLFILLGIEQIEIVDRVFLQLSYLHFLASNRQRQQIESSYSCPIYTSQHRIDRDSRQSLLTVVLFALLGIEQIEIVDRVFLQLSYLYFLASNRQRQQIESSYSCPICTSCHRIDRDLDRVFLQLSFLYFLASNRQRSQIESSYSCPICTSWHRIDRDRRQSLLTVVLFILLSIEQIEIVDRVFLQLSYLHFLASNRQRQQIESSYSCPYLHFLASNRQRQQIESSYSCPIYTSQHRIDRDSRQSLLTVVLFILLGIEQIEIVDRVFLQLSYLHFLASNRQRQQIESSYSCPIYTSQHRIDRDSRQSLLTVVLFILLSIEQIEIVDRVFLQLSYLHFLASNRQRQQIESSYSCPIYTSQHRIDRDRRQSLLTVVLFALLGIEQIEIVDRVFLQLSYLYFLASNRQRSQIESSYSCPICTSWHRIDRDSRQSLLTVVLFILLGIEQIEIVDRVFLQLSYLHFLASNRQRQQIESSYSCPIYTSQHRIDRDRRQSLLTVVLFALLGIEQIEIVDRVFLQLSYLYFLASNRQRQQIESSYSCPIYTSWHRIDRDSRQSLLTVVLFALLGIEQIEIVDRVFLQLSYLYFLASNRQRQQIESSYSCPIYTSQHRIDRDRRQSLLTVVLFILLGIEQIEIVDRVFLQLSYLHFLASNRQRQQIESSYSCPIYISQHRIDRDSRQSLLTVVLFALLGIEQIEIVDRVFLQLSYLYFLASNRQRSQIESSYSCPICTSWHQIDRDSRQSLLTVVLFALLGIEQIEIVDRVFLQLSYLHFLASNRQRQQIESSYSCPSYSSYTSCIEQIASCPIDIEIEIDRVFLQLSYLYFLASNRQRSQIESSYSCPICTSQHRNRQRSQIESSYSCPRQSLLQYLYCTSWHRIDRDSRQSLLTVVLFPICTSQHRIDRDSRQSLLTVVLFILLGIEQIEIVDRVFLQLSYLYFLASNRQRSQIESSYSCPICTSWHRIDRDSRQSLLTVVLFILLSIEQIEIVDRVFLQLSICTSWHRIDRDSRQSLLTVVLFILLSIEQIEIVDRVFLQLSYLYFLASNRQRSQIESSYSCPICTSWHRIDRDRRQSLLTVVLFILLSIEQIEIVDRVFLQLSYLHFLASNRQRSQIESSYSCPICTSQHRIDRDSRQSLLTVVLFILLGIEQIEIVDRVFLQLSYLHFLASNRQRSQIESSYSCPIYISQHRIDRDRRQSLLTVVLFALLGIEQIEIVDRVFLQLSYLYFLASNRQRQQIESSYSCPIYTSWHRIDRDSRQSLLTVVLFALLGIEQIEIVDRVFLQLSYLYFLASNRQRQQIESSYSCPIYTSWHRIDRDRRQSLLTVVLFILLSIEQIEIVDRVFLQLSYLHFLASNRQRQQIESSYSCPIYASCIEQIEIVDRVFLQLSYLYFLASNRQRQQIESSYSCPICTSWHRIDRDRRQSLLTVVLFALLSIEQIEIVDRVFLQLSYLHFLASNRQRQQIESSYSCPIYTSWHRIDRDPRVFLQLSYLYFLASNRQRSQIESSYSCPICTSQHRIDRDRRQSLLTVVLFALLGIEQIEIVDRVFLQLSYLHFLASNRQRQQIESSYSCPIYTSQHRIDRDRRQSLLTVVLFALLGIEQIEIVDRVFLQLSYLYFLASNRQRQQIESSYSCPICTSQHRIDRDSRQSLLTVVLFALLGIEQIEIVDRVFLQLSYLYFLASNRQRQQIESSYSCPICTSWHRIDRDRRQSLLTVVLFILLGIEQIEIVDRVFLQLSYLHFLASNRQRQQIESSYSCPIYTSWHRIDRDRRQSLLTVVLFALLGIEQIEIVDRVFLQLSYLHFLASNRQRSQIESSYSCPICTSWHRIDRNSRQSLLTVVLFMLLCIEQIEIVDRVFLQLSYLYFLASNRQRQQIESSYSCPIYTSWHRIDRDSRQSLLTVVLFALLSIEQIEIVDRVFLQLSYLHFLASNRQRQQIESSYSCPICTSWHRIDRDRRQSLLTVVLFILLGIELSTISIFSMLRSINRTTVRTLYLLSLSIRC